MKDRDQARSIGKEGDQVVGELGHGRVDLDHRVPRLHKVEPVVLEERAPQALEQAELAERCGQRCSWFRHGASVELCFSEGSSLAIVVFCFEGRVEGCNAKVNVSNGVVK